MEPVTRRARSDAPYLAQRRARSDAPYLLAALVWCGAAVFAVSSAFGQQPLAAHIGYVYPAGGRQGSSFQVKIGGQLLDGVTNVFVSGTGVKASVVEYHKPLTQAQFNNLRDKLRELQEKRTAAMRTNWRRNRQQSSQSSTNVTWTAEDEKAVAEIRKKIAGFIRRPQNPAIAETVSLQVTVSPDCEPGERELRIGTRLGLSNPLVFCVGQLPEISKKETKPNEFAPFRAQKIREEQEAVAPTEMTVPVPATINGQILQGGVDRYRFSARKGQQLVVVVKARALIPYLPDAVPGWFQATLKLTDAKGKEVEYADDYRFHPDPVMRYEVPRDGEYILEIKDSIYRGREDFVYRIEIGELPFITGIFPLGGRAGETIKVSVDGWNLPTKDVVQALPGDAPSTSTFSVRKGDWISNRVPFASDTLPEVLADGANNSTDKALRISLPVIINGRIEKPGAAHLFRFAGRAGDEVAAEVYARRLDSPLDSTLKLMDAAGKPIAFNDDTEDKGSGLNTHHADSYLRVKLPADGDYYLCLNDAQRQGGRDYAYRLRVSPPRPDFDLRLAPSSLTTRPGTCVPVTVYALRKDGFTNGIALRLKDPPSGFALSGGWIPAGQDRVRLTIAGASMPGNEPVELFLEGHATVNTRPVTHLAVPAEDMMQAFAYRHLVPSQELLVQAAAGPGARFLSRAGSARLVNKEPVRIPAGGSATVRVSGPAWFFSDRVQFELDQAPEGIVLKKVSADRDGGEIVLASEAGKAKPGLKGNLIVEMVPGAGATFAQKAKKQVNVRRVTIGTLPAIPFEIVEK